MSSLHCKPTASADLHLIIIYTVPFSEQGQIVGVLVKCTFSRDEYRYHLLLDRLLNKLASIERYRNGLGSEV